MPGLRAGYPRLHAQKSCEAVDGRDKPGHNDGMLRAQMTEWGTLTRRLDEFQRHAVALADRRIFLAIIFTQAI